MEKKIVMGIGTEVVKLVNEVDAFFTKRPELDLKPFILGIDEFAVGELEIELITFGEEKRQEEERPVYYNTLIKILERKKSQIIYEIKQHEGDILLIANLGGGTGSVAVARIPHWLNELRRNVSTICIIPFPRISTYRPILTENVIPAYRELRGMLHGREIRSILYMDRGFSNKYTDFNKVFQDTLVDLLLIDRENDLLSRLEGELTVGLKRIEFQYQMFGKKFHFMTRSGCRKEEKRLEITDIDLLTKKEVIKEATLYPQLLVSEDTKDKLEKLELTLSLADFSERHGVKVKDITYCDWIYNNSMDLVMVFKDLKGYAPLEEIIKKSPEYQKSREAEIELKYEYDGSIAENFYMLNAIKVGSLKQEDRYFEVGEGKELRLRSDESGCRLTFKSKKGDDSLVRHELEIVVECLEDYQTLFEHLGYTLKGVIKKERKEFLVYHGGEEYILTLDSVESLGRFLELKKNVIKGFEQETLSKMKKLAKTWGLKSEVKEPYLQLLLKREKNQ